MIADVLGQVESGLIDFSGLWVAASRNRPVGAMLSQALAGRAAALWPPEVESGRGIDRGAVASALVAEVLADYRRRGFQLAQALVGSDAPEEAAADLERGGLPRVTELIYLSRPTANPLELPSATSRLVWQSYEEMDHGLFGRLLAQTYVGSLDMPELEGLRSLEDVLAGHRAGGRFDPKRWKLGRVPGEPDAAAVVLLSGPAADDPRRGVPWELAYLGLTPPARGRGLGLAALAHALEMARPVADRLELAVDVRNTPADRLYRSAGFTPFDRRAVHVAQLASSYSN